MFNQRATADVEEARATGGASAHEGSASPSTELQDLGFQSNLKDYCDQVRTSTSSDPDEDEVQPESKDKLQRFESMSVFI